MLTLSEKDLKDLNDYCNEIPTKYGLPLLNFIQKLIAEKKEEKKEKKKDEDK